MHKQPTDQQPPYAWKNQAAQKEDRFTHKEGMESKNEWCFLYSFYKERL